MASSTAPNHDFAPAWLKIPSNSQKQQQPNTVTADQSYRREEVLFNSSSSSHSTTRNSSSEPRRERGRSGIPYRHHSIDADDLQRPSSHSSSSNNGSDYSLVTGYKQHSGSQPSLGRRSNSRQDFRETSFTSKGSNSFDCSEPHRSNNSHWGRQRSFERTHGGNSGHNGRNHGLAENAQNISSPNWSDKKLDKFELEFPSLKGDSVSNETSSASASSNTSVWDMSKSGKFHLSSSSVGKKIHLIQKPLSKEGGLRNSSPNGANGNISPKNVSTTVKQPMKLNSGSNVTSVYKTLSAKGLRRANNDSVKLNGQIGKTNFNQEAITSQMEKLNTRLVTHPKNVGNKSDFLKELRDDNGLQETDIKDSWEDEIKNEIADDVKCDDQPLTNGIDKNEHDYEVDDHVHYQTNGIDIQKQHSEDRSDDSVLSRSLEAEQRLLREMGWKEEGSDDELIYAPLTEDEVNEFRKLPKQLPKRCNELPRNIQFTWSPKRVLSISTATLKLGNDLSSTSTSDSDSD